MERQFGETREPLRRRYELARRVKGVWKSLGGKFEWPAEMNTVRLDLERARVSLEMMRAVTKEKGFKLTRGRIVLDYQTSDVAVERTGGGLREVLKI